VEYEDAKIATWNCAGHYFDFEDVGYDDIDEQNPYSVRLSDWHYNVVPGQTGASSTSEDRCTWNIETKSVTWFEVLLFL